MNSSITFLYPSRTIGGAQLLFVRLAKKLSEYRDVSVNVVDYPDGYLREQLESFEHIKILPYKNGSVELETERNVIVTPLSNLSDFKFMVIGDFSQIVPLFWAINPYGLEHVLKDNLRRYFPAKEVTASFVQSLSKSGNVIYMDEANLLAVQEIIEARVQPKYLPIPLEIKEGSYKVKSKSETLNLGWIGRISFDKINSIIKIVDEIQLTQKKIRFHIIGGGDKISELRKHLEGAEIEYLLPGILVDENLDSYIKENIDVGVAMGTSCIEFATRKVPVFIIDFSDKRFPEDIKYNWLFETSNYTLGSHVNTATVRNHSFSDLILQYEQDDSLGEKCFLYVKENHSLEQIAQRLYDHCKSLKRVNLAELNLVHKNLNPRYFRAFYGVYRKLLEVKGKLLNKKRKV